MNHTQNTYIASLLGYDGTEDENEQQDLSSKTPEELLAMCQPYLAKLLARQELTAEEAEAHAAIIAEARRQHDALRAREMAERLERLSQE